MRNLCAALWLVVGACGADPSAGSPSSQGAPIPVDVAEARPGTLRDGWRLSADVRALSRSSLAPQVGGQVVEVGVREGDRVRRRQPMLRVDPEIAEADVQGAQADRAVAQAEASRAEAELARLEGLSTGVVSATDRDLARAEAEASSGRVLRAQADLARARATLGRHTLRAPYDGVVALRRVDPGDHVTVGQAVFDLVSDEGVEVIVDGPAALLSTLAVGDQAKVAGPGGATLTAELVGLVPALDPVTRTVRGRLSLAERPGWVVPGANVDVTLGFDRQVEGAVVVPRDALMDGAGDPAVIKLDEEDVARRVLVEVIARNDIDALVSGELAAGDRVVIRGNERLRTGQSVAIRRAQGAAEVR